MATSDKKRSLLTEVPTVGVYPNEETYDKLEPIRQKQEKEFLNALQETKSARDKAIGHAHDALVDAFGPKLASQVAPKMAEAIGMKVTSQDYVSELDIDQLIKELEGAPEDDDMVKECRRRLDEAKDPTVPTSEKERMYRDIHRKFWAYFQSLGIKDFSQPKKLTETDQAVRNFMTNKNGPIKWVSHEASMLICTLISISDSGTAYINLNQLPELDRALVINMTGGKITTGFSAKFDQYKNFECACDDREIKKGIYFTLGNRAASIPPHETKFGSDVKVEKKGKEIVIGDTIKLEKNRIQNLVNQPDPTNNGANRGTSFVPHQKVSGRNAYEIRQDIIENAIEVIRLSNNTKGVDYHTITDDVLDIAERLYDFVEHKK